MSEKYLDTKGLAYFTQKFKQYIKDKNDALAPVARTGSFEDLSDKPFGEESGSFDIVCHAIGMTQTSNPANNWNITSGELPDFSTGNHYTVVFRGRTYENLEVVSKHGVSCLGNAGAAVRAVIGLQMQVTPAELLSDKPNDCEFVFTYSSSSLGDFYSFGCYIDHTFYQSEVESIEIIDPSTGDSICTAEITVYSNNVLLNTTTDYPSMLYYLDSEEAAAFNPPADGAEQSFTVNGIKYTYTWADMQGGSAWFLGDMGLMTGAVSAGTAIVAMAVGTGYGFVLLCMADENETNDDFTLSFAYSNITTIDKKFLDVAKVGKTGSFTDLVDKPVSVNYSPYTAEFSESGMFYYGKIWSAVDSDLIDVTSAYASKTKLTFTFNDNDFTDQAATGWMESLGIPELAIETTLEANDLIYYLRQSGSETLKEATGWTFPFYIGCAPDNTAPNALKLSCNNFTTVPVVVLTGNLQVTFDKALGDTNTYPSGSEVTVTSAYLRDLRVLGSAGTHSITVSDSNSLNVTKSFTCTETTGPYPALYQAVKYNSSDRKGTWTTISDNVVNFTQGFSDDVLNGYASSTLWGKTNESVFITWDNVEYELKAYGELTSPPVLEPDADDGNTLSGLYFGNSSYSQAAAAAAETPKYPEVPFLVSVISDQAKVNFKGTILAKTAGPHKFHIYRKDKYGAKITPIFYAIKTGVSGTSANITIYNDYTQLPRAESFPNTVYQVALDGVKYQATPEYISEKPAVYTGNVSGASDTPCPYNPEYILNSKTVSSQRKYSGYFIGDIGLFYETIGLRFESSSNYEARNIIDVTHDIPFCFLVSDSYIGNFPNNIVAVFKRPASDVMVNLEFTSGTVETLPTYYLPYKLISAEEIADLF